MTRFPADVLSGNTAATTYRRTRFRRLIIMAVMAPSAHNRQPWPFVVARAESGRGERDSVFRVRTGDRPTVAWKILGTARRE
jgi:hypothetical protein